MLEVIPTSRLHGVIQDRLRRFILDSQLRPGDKLPTEKELSGRLGASRSAVREALRSLEALGMIEVKHGKGRFLRAFDVASIASNLAYSLTFDAASIRDLLEVRRTLETSFIAQATRKLEASRIDRLYAIVEQMALSADAGRAFIEEDMAFHKVLFGALHNEVLKKILDVFWGLFQHLHARNVLPPGEAAATVAYHRQIVDAMAAKDVTSAREALDEHFRDVERRLESAIEATGEEVSLPTEFVS